MDEAYTCVCKGQRWSIHDGFIRCDNCQEEYETKSICFKWEYPSEFNERIRKSGKEKK